MNTQKTGRNKPRGRGGGRGHTRRHTAATDHTTDRSGGQAEGRQGGGERDAERGTRMALRLALRLGSGGGGERRGDTAAGREQGETERKRVCNIFKGERRERNAAETRKSIQVCVYTYHLNTVACGLLIALSFIY